MAKLELINLDTPRKIAIINDIVDEYKDRGMKRRDQWQHVTSGNILYRLSEDDNEYEYDWTICIEYNNQTVLDFVKYLLGKEVDSTKD